MQPVTYPVVGIIAVLASVASSAKAEPAVKDGVRQSLQAAYNARNASISRKDVKAALSCYAPRFLYVSREGQFSDRIASENLMSSLFETAQTLSVSTKIHSLTLQSGDVVALGEQNVHLVLPPDRGNPRYHTVTVRDITRDVWFFRGLNGG